MTGSEAPLPLDAPLPPLRVDGRRNRVLHALADNTDVDAFVITNLVNVRWLTGFTGSAGMVVVTPERMALITDGRYDQQAERELTTAGSDVEVIITSAQQKERAQDIVGNAPRVGLEAEHITWDRQRTMRDSWFPNARIAATTGIVDHLRRRKDAGELARIERAAAITDAALAQTLPLMHGEITEAAFAFELETTMRRLGAASPAFDTIVASGPNGAVPHHRTSDRAITDGDMIVIDCGAMVEGYRSDMTRTYVKGTPSIDQQRMFDVVIAAQQAGVDTVAPDVATRDVDEACRSIIREAGWGDAFVHGTGHGVGLDIHELPRVGSTATDVLVHSDVMTVEPGVYLADRGGIRIEDTVAVTDRGGRRLTHTPKTLTIPSIPATPATPAV